MADTSTTPRATSHQVNRSRSERSPRPERLRGEESCPSGPRECGVSSVVSDTRSLATVPACHVRKGSSTPGGAREQLHQHLRVAPHALGGGGSAGGVRLPIALDQLHLLGPLELRQPAL